MINIKLTEWITPEDVIGLKIEKLCADAMQIQVELLEPAGPAFWYSSALGPGEWRPLKNGQQVFDMIEKFNLRTEKKSNGYWHAVSALACGISTSLKWAVCECVAITHSQKD